MQNRLILTIHFSKTLVLTMGGPISKLFPMFLRSIQNDRRYYIYKLF